MAADPRMGGGWPPVAEWDELVPDGAVHEEAARGLQYRTAAPLYTDDPAEGQFGLHDQSGISKVNVRRSRG